MINEREVAAGFERPIRFGALPVARGLAFDACTVRGNQRAFAGTAWSNAFAIDSERIMLVTGVTACSSADLAGALRRLVTASGADSRSMLLAAAAVLRDEAPPTAACATVGIVDHSAHTLTYISMGRSRPYLRYDSGTLAALPANGTVAPDYDLPHVVVDLRGAALLLFYTDGLVRAIRNVDAGLRRLGHVLADERLLHCASPTAWIARRMLDDRVHDDVALLAVTLTSGGRDAPAAPEPRWTVNWSFEATAAASNAARCAFLDCLSSKGDRTGPIDLAAAELIFGELLGNVVRHAPGQVDVSLDWTAALPVLHVRDNGPGYRRPPEREGLPVDELSESGRGLFIIRAYAKRFRVRPREGGGSHAIVTLPLLAR